MLDAHTTAPTAAELDTALVFTADGYSDADGVGHVTVAAAERSVKAASAPHPSRAIAMHEREMNELMRYRLVSRSPALDRLICEAMDLKREAFNLGQAHERASKSTFRAKEFGGDIDAANAVEIAAEKVWMAARDRLEDKASEVLDAPFDDLNDVLIRTDAFALLLGDPQGGEDGDPLMPVFAEDLESAYLSLRRAIVEIIDTHRPSERMDEAEVAYRTAQEEFERVAKSLEDNAQLIANGGIVEPSVQEQLKARLSVASEVSDTAANAVLAERPTTLPHLLLQMQIVMAEIVTHDLTTHAKRGRWLGDLPVTVEELRQDDRGLETRGWALIAENAARLAQLDLSSGWRALMADEGGIVKLHRNARDVLALAASKDIDPARFSGIHLTGRDDDKLPQMTFRTADGHAIAMPGVVYDWKPVQ